MKITSNSSGKIHIELEYDEVLVLNGEKLADDSDIISIGYACDYDYDNNNDGDDDRDRYDEAEDSNIFEQAIANAQAKEENIFEKAIANLGIKEEPKVESDPLGAKLAERLNNISLEEKLSTRLQAIESESKNAASLIAKAIKF